MTVLFFLRAKKEKKIKIPIYMCWYLLKDWEER